MAGVSDVLPFFVVCSGACLLTTGKMHHIPECQSFTWVIVVKYSVKWHEL